MAFKTITLDQWEEQLERTFPKYAETRVIFEKQKKEFGQNITSYIISTGVDEEELARYCGLEPEAICQMKEGKYKPQPRTLENLAEALECKAEELWPNY